MDYFSRLHKKNFRLQHQQSMHTQNRIVKCQPLLQKRRKNSVRNTMYHFYTDIDMSTRVGTLQLVFCIETNAIHGANEFTTNKSRPKSVG